MANDSVVPPVRIDGELLQAVRLMAASRDETVSQVVRRLLRLYVAQGSGEVDLDAAILALRCAAVPKTKHRRRK